MSSVILVTGEALIDLVIAPDGQVTAALGGAPFNTARACGRLGADVSFVGAISIDRFGTMLADQLVADGVSLGSAPRVEVPTTLAAAELDDGGAASYRFYIDNTSAPALTTAADTAAADVVFAGGLGLVLEPMATTVEAMLSGLDGPLVMVDVNCRPLVVPDRDRYVARVRRVIAGAHVVKVSDEDLAYLAPGVDTLAAAGEVLAGGPSAVLVTAGGGEVHVLTAAGSTSVPVQPVDVVDTIGAGDSFGGGFLSWWSIAGHPVAAAADLDALVPAVRAANTIAGIVCSRRGADPPWRRDLPADWSP